MTDKAFTTAMMRLMGDDALRQYADTWKQIGEHHARSAVTYQTLARRARREMSRRKSRK